MESGKYEEAITAFKQIKDYSDSKEKAGECIEQFIIELAENGEFDVIESLTDDFYNIEGDSSIETEDEDNQNYYREKFEENHVSVNEIVYQAAYEKCYDYVLKNGKEYGGDEFEGFALEPMNTTNIDGLEYTVGVDNEKEGIWLIFEYVKEGSISTGLRWCTAMNGLGGNVLASIPVKENEENKTILMSTSFNNASYRYIQLSQPVRLYKVL